MKKKFIAFQIIIAVILVCTSVYSALSTTIDLTQSTNSVKRGDKVTVTLSLRGVDSNKKIMSVSGYINYNKDVVEDITADSIQKDSNGKVRIGNEELSVEDLTNADVNNMPSTNAYIGFNGNPTSGNDTRLVIDFNNGITADTDLLKIDFNVKSNATLGEIRNAISYSMFVVSADTEQSEEITKNIDITVQAVPSDDDPIDNNVNNNTNTNNQNVDNTNSNTNKNNTNTNTNTNKNNTNTNNTNSNTNKNNTNTNSNTNKNNTNTNSNTNKNNTNTNSNTNKNNTNTNSNTNKKDNTTSGSTLPKTGAASLIILPIIAVLVLAIVSYKKYRQYKDI